MNAAEPPAGPGIRVVTVPYSDPYVDAVLPHGIVRTGPAQGPSPWLDPAYLAADHVATTRHHDASTEEGTA